MSSSPDLTPMEQILEQRLEEAAAELPAGQAPTIPDAILILDDGQQVAGAIKRGPLPRTYVCGQPMQQQTPHGPRTVEGKLAEIVFLGADIKRLVQIRDVTPILVPSRKIVMP